VIVDPERVWKYDPAKGYSKSLNSPWAGHTLTVEDMRAFCRERIAHYKVPRYLRVTEEFPMTVTGKVQKYRMREISIAELGLGDAASQPTA
jgi:fatty-acyl-CoA synthase